MTINRVQLQILTTCITLLMVLLPSCSRARDNLEPSIFPPSAFTEDSLIATWQESGVADSKETIVMASDHKYRQIFDIPESNYHYEQEGSWELKKAQNGCVYIYFYGMKYFYQDQELVNNGNLWASGIKKGEAEKYWDECSENLIEMPNMVVMFVSQHPSYPRNIVLRDMATQRDVVDIIFSLTDSQIKAIN